MAYDMIKTVLQAESLARKSEEEARQQAQAILESARETAASLEEAALSQAQKQANKLADMREKKVIADTEKRYDEAIRLVLDHLTD